MSPFWFIVFLLSILVEYYTVGLVAIWFSIGSLITLFCSFFIENLFIQFAIFVISSFIILIFTKAFVKKFKLVKHECTNCDRVIGKVGEVVKDIKENDFGQVDVMGSIWSAVSSEEICSGSKVIVEKIEGSKLIVRKGDK